MGALFTPPTGVIITKQLGRRYSFYGKLAVNWVTFGGGQTDGYSPDIFVPFTTQGLQFLNLGSGSGSVVEVSFDGSHVDLELNPTNPSAGITQDFRVESLIWFRIQAGSAGPVTVSLSAWAPPTGG